jgi:hypothetical protein
MPLKIVIFVKTEMSRRWKVFAALPSPGKAVVNVMGEAPLP